MFYSVPVLTGWRLGLLRSDAVSKLGLTLQVAEQVPAHLALRAVVRLHLGAQHHQVPIGLRKSHSQAYRDMNHRNKGHR